MPISFSLNETKGYLEVKCKGWISDREIFRERLTYLSTADWIPGTYELVDLSEADFSGVTPAGIQYLSSVIDKIYRANGLERVKVAVYTEELLTAAITSVYSEFAETSVEDIRVFDDLVKAESWLRQ